MTFRAVMSDQLLNWSDDDDINTDFCSAAKTNLSPAPIASSGGPPPRLAHRALQAVRETGLQVCSGPGSWAEVLSLGQPFGEATGDGIRPSRLPRVRCPLPRQLPARAGDPGRDLHHQPRTPAPSRGAVGDIDELAVGRDIRRKDRCRRRRHRAGQHARGCSRRFFVPALDRGGSR